MMEDNEKDKLKDNGIQTMLQLVRKLIFGHTFFKVCLLTFILFCLKLDLKEDYRQMLGRYSQPSNPWFVYS